jgi:hypothetical protein
LALDQGQRNPSAPVSEPAFGQCRLRKFWGPDAIPIPGPPCRSEPRRQGDEAARLELAQQIATGNFSKKAVGLAPIPDSAKPAGKVRATVLSLLDDEFADSLEILGPDPPPPDAQFLCHSVIVAKGTTRRQNYFRTQYDEHLRSPLAKP